MKKNWYITGISRGFGKVLSTELLNMGCSVVGTVRASSSELKHDCLHVQTLDVTKPNDVRDSLKDAQNYLSTIDVVVNNAGFGVLGAVEEVNLEEAKHVFETNVFGTLNVIQAALPYLRKQKSGHFVNFSSVGGFSALPGFGIYCASKFAIEGLSEALAEEVKPLGIRVTIVEPGAFRTDFLSGHSLLRTTTSISDYKDSSGQTRQWADQAHGKQPGDPVLGMKALIQAINESEPPLRLPLGADAIERMKKKIADVEADIQRGESVARATGFFKPSTEKCVA